MFDFINEWLFAPILKAFLFITGNHYALSIFLFTLAVNIILIPLTIKSQKAAVSQLKIKPKLDELKKKCGDDKQKYNQGMQQIYRENNVSMGGGCLPMIIRLVLVMSVYWLVLSPLTYSNANIRSATINPVKEVAVKEVTVDGEKDAGVTENYAEIEIIKVANTDFDKLDKADQERYSGVKHELAAIKEKAASTDYTLFGIDLTREPNFSMNLSKVPLKEMKLWIIPLLSFAAAMLSSIYSIIHQKRTNPDGPRMTGMMLFMPLFSLWIAFSAPCGLGFYWACSSLIGMFIQMYTNKFYSPARLVAKEQAKFILKRATEEKKYLAGSAK